MRSVCTAARAGLMVLSPDALAEHLNRAAGRIQQITGQEPCRLFRPHAGWRSATMVRGVGEGGLSPGRVELGNVGLGLVAQSARGARWQSDRAKGVGGGHHRDPRWAPQESRGRPPARRGDDRADRATLANPWLQVRHPAVMRRRRFAFAGEDPGRQEACVCHSTSASGQAFRLESF